MIYVSDYLEMKKREKEREEVRKMWSGRRDPAHLRRRWGWFKAEGDVSGGLHGYVSLNHTGVSYTVFHLLGIPGLEDQHMWISIPFFFSYVIALSGNSLLIFIIVTKHSLHEPMYLFLCMLAGADFVLSTCVVPQALAIFWFCAGEISLNRCITQFFITHSTFMSESGTLLVVAFDCYIAICFYPLRYTTILTHTLIGKIGVTIILRSYCMIFPMIFLLKRLTFRQSNIIPRTCCEHIGLAKYACNDIRVNIWYGLFVIMSTVVLDVLLIFVSYTLILHAVFHVPPQDACHKALNTCGSHVCIILLFYGAAIITTLTQQFGSQVPPHIHILLDNVCILAPPMLNPITYGIKSKQIREQVAHIFFPMQK
ncbi:olfactory receptor 52B4-like [Balaenoptera acutorostrata]|uniref:Olfactory receptor 52B4-like n=1 Tax=Balaenoptera acutorostrata TaxID=9767 RepID=A0A383ZFF3_BALAC|nr:olfactory receptor 52B4-like [Balaenoptera acutorostrata]